jgi:hypothetical protein
MLISPEDIILMGPLGWTRSITRASILLSLLLINVMPLAAEAVMFTLRSNSVLSKKPNYKTMNRLDLKVDDVVVEGPALEQSADFCRYKIFDREGQPLTPETAWVPCHSIDKLFIVP